jgi:hypothetical protein
MIQEPVDLSRNPLTQLPSESISLDSSHAALSGIKDVNTEAGGLPPEKEFTADDVVAALEAALRQAASQSRGGSEVNCNGDDLQNHFSPVDEAGSLDHQMEEELMELCVLSDYGSDRILTEDGDTILNSGKLHFPSTYRQLILFTKLNY